MEEKERQILQEGYLCLQDNPFWLWALGQMAEKRQYLAQRLTEAKSWEEVCRLQGGLAALAGLWGVCAAMGQYEAEKGQEGYST